MTVRLAIVDDAYFVRASLTRLLEGHEQVEVVGAAGTGEELLANLDLWKRDVITLDLNMPGMGGLATLDCLRARAAAPVIILSTHSPRGAPMTIEALSRGAANSRGRDHEGSRHQEGGCPRPRHHSEQRRRQE